MNGVTIGVASTIIIFPESGSAVIALCSLRKPPVYAIAREAAKIAFGAGNETTEQDEEEELENVQEHSLEGANMD